MFNLLSNAVWYLHYNYFGLYLFSDNYLPYDSNLYKTYIFKRYIFKNVDTGQCKKVMRVKNSL